MSKSSNKYIVDFLQRRSTWVLIGFLILTCVIIVPLLFMGSTEQASLDPPSEVFELQNEIDFYTQSASHEIPFVVEARGSDVLSQEVLWELYRNTERLREADKKGELTPAGLPVQPYLYSSFDPVLSRRVEGVASIAEAVAIVLSMDPRFNTSLENASDDQVKIAIHHIFANEGAHELIGALSSKASSQQRTVEGNQINYWTSPALVFLVLADNEKLGGGSFSINIGGGDTVKQKEQLGRKVQDILRGSQVSYSTWGVAIDANLEAEEEGRSAGLFIMFTVIASIIIVGVSLRSYWATALTAVGIGTLMVWLKGITALIGLKGGLITDLIVPIAMIAFGVDFAVHAIRRYHEERASGNGPLRAYHLGMSGVLGALVLAMVSDGVAFLANVSSGVEAVVHFGLAAAIAIVSSFLILGVIVPLANARIDGFIDSLNISKASVNKVLVAVSGAGVAVLSGISVILLLAVSQWLGIVVLAFTTVTFLVLPLLIAMWMCCRLSYGRNSKQHTRQLEVSHWPIVESIVIGLARNAAPVLIIIAIATIVIGFYAARLEPTFDAKDFFDEGSDFVMGLDKMDEHIGLRGGEPGLVYIKGDLTDPEALSVIKRFVEDLVENPYVARNPDGTVPIETNVLSLLDKLLSSDYALAEIQASTSVEIVDHNFDGIPDSVHQVKAALDYVKLNGVPLDEGTLIFDQGQVAEVLFHSLDADQEGIAVLTIGIPGTREQTIVTSARKSLEKSLSILARSESISRFGITGSPFMREAQLDATTRSLRIALPIAIAGALVVLLAAMRSIRYATVTVIPIVLAVTWLYGIMYLLGFSLNLVTATIGAVSIGVGIDYSIHMTERFREELLRSESKIDSLRNAVRGTGVALVASATSSVIGFAIMGFAPMPMFASYGVLTAIMICLALLASLAVLPSLLIIVTPDRGD